MILGALQTLPGSGAFFVSSAYSLMRPDALLQLYIYGKFFSRYYCKSRQIMVKSELGIAFSDLASDAAGHGFFPRAVFRGVREAQPFTKRWKKY